MMQNAKQILGVVLAGGRSSRMGTDKSALPWQGRRLLDHMCSLLLESGVDKVVVSGDVAGYECRMDVQPGSGPGRALSSLLADLPEYARVLVVPVDMPLLSTALLRTLLNTGAGCYAGYPLPAVLPTRSKTGALLQADSIRGLHQQAGSVMLDAPDNAEKMLANLNTPIEWEWAKGLMG